MATIYKNSADDALLMAVLASRLDGIVREMTNTLLRSARSGVIAVCRDFSCSLTTGDGQFLAAAEGVPVHVFGSDMLAQSMLHLHPDVAEGDAFLHNDPQMGNTHAADHTIIVPIFFEGELMFTACAKAHQADIGNSIPSTYHPIAKDIYEEGALIFPCVQIQKDFQMNEDIVRMCRARIRVADQWYGDFLAAIGAARVAERRLKELCAKYGKDRIKTFVKDWFDYSERKIASAIKRLPEANLTSTAAHDPVDELLPEGVPINVKIDIDATEGIVEVDLRDNIDTLDCGLNVSEGCTLNHAIAGVLNSLGTEVPANAGSFRRFKVLMRDGSVIGRPSYPASCSMGTTNVGARLCNCIQKAFAELGDGFGLAEGGTSMAAGWAVVSGPDFRRGGEPFINQLFITSAGGPGTPVCDGWLNYGLPGAAGLLYRDSVELDEVKHPMEVKSLKIVNASGGAGKFRGAPGNEVVFGPKKDPMTVAIACDGQVYPPAGVRGGADAICAETHRVFPDGREETLPNVAQFDLLPGEYVRGLDNSGGGYGNPMERDPARVLHDVLEGWETVERAEKLYGVAFTGSVHGDDLALNADKTNTLRNAS